MADDLEAIPLPEDRGARVQRRARRPGRIRAVSLVVVVAAAIAAAFTLGSSSAPRPRELVRVVNSCPSAREVSLYDGSQRRRAIVEVPAVGVVEMPGVEASDVDRGWTVGVAHEGGEVRESITDASVETGTVFVAALSCGPEVSG